MKTYKNYGTAKKYGATESVFVDGEERWASPGIRPEKPKVAAFAMKIGGRSIEGYDRTASFGKFDGAYVMRVDGVSGGHTINIFTNEEDGELAFSDFVASYKDDNRWVAK